MSSLPGLISYKNNVIFVSYWGLCCCGAIIVPTSLTKFHFHRPLHSRISLQPFLTLSPIVPSPEAESHKPQQSRVTAVCKLNVNHSDLFNSVFSWTKNREEATQFQHPEVIKCLQSRGPFLFLSPHRQQKLKESVGVNHHHLPTLFNIISINPLVIISSDRSPTSWERWQSQWVNDRFLGRYIDEPVSS